MKEGSKVSVCKLQKNEISYLYYKGTWKKSNDYADWKEKEFFSMKSQRVGGPGPR